MRREGGTPVAAQTGFYPLHPRGRGRATCSANRPCFKSNGMRDCLVIDFGGASVCRAATVIQAEFA